MKRRKALSLLLILTILLSLVLPATTALADDTTDGGTDDKGMHISKTASYNGDGTYTVQLEAYATGAKSTTTITEEVPTDIILVLDQSGSMDDDIGKVQFTEYKDVTNYGGTTYHTRNCDYYDYRHNGGSSNLWHKLDDGSFVSVSVMKTQEFTPLNTNLPNYSNRNDCYYDYANNLYEKVGEEYKKVSFDYDYQGWPTYDYVFTYTFNDGTTVSSTGSSTVPNLGSHAPLYTPVADGNDTVYTYTYTDASGTTQTIGTSTGADTKFTPVFYERTTVAAGIKRIDALKSAVTTFVNQVAAKAAGEDKDITTTADNINHRIAVVGFASESNYGNNTELLSINGRNSSGNVGVAYGSITDQNLKDVVQNMDTTAGQQMVTKAINALATNGATRTDLGLDMAQRILEQNPVPAGEKRNRVVIVFTDGSPTSQSAFEQTVADNAITKANSIKAAGATIYSIGIFSGADASCDGNINGTDTEKCNWFMHRISSNKSYPQTPSYYLSADGHDALNNIFSQISDQIQEGTSSTLKEDAIVKDIISPYFTLPEGATKDSITLETYKYHGPDQAWTPNNNAMGATAEINGDQVNVTDFNFSENYVGAVTVNGAVTGYHGNKLVITFKVQPKAGFLGGNSVITNTNAGIYENGEAKEPLLTFEQPIVNVPIPALTVTAEDKNVYLLGNVTAEQIRSGVTVSVGSVALNLDPTVPNYGLADWQTKYVEINITYKDAAGNVLTDRTGLTDDTTYSVEVTVTPKDVTVATDIGPAATEAKGSASGKINVFKPELTYKDSTAYYGDTAPDYTGNLQKTEWKHGETLSTEVTMIAATAPNLVPTYAPDKDTIVNGKINTKKDIGVDVKVKIDERDITDHTTFLHENCDPACGWKDPTRSEDPEFLIHIKTCTLTITKINGADDETYVFDVLKDGVKYSEVTLQGTGAGSSQTLIELPVGNYTITENSGWSWRYKTTPTYGGNGTLSAGNPNGELTCTNEKENDSWLDGYSEVTRNIYGFAHTTTANDNN